jgi:hypothetical protein
MDDIFTCQECNQTFSNFGPSWECSDCEERYCEGCAESMEIIIECEECQCTHDELEEEDKEEHKECKCLCKGEKDDFHTKEASKEHSVLGKLTWVATFCKCYCYEGGKEEEEKDQRSGHLRTTDRYKVFCDHSVNSSPEIAAKIRSETDHKNCECQCKGNHELHFEKCKCDCKVECKECECECDCSKRKKVLTCNQCNGTSVSDKELFKYLIKKAGFKSKEDAKKAYLEE